MGIIPLSILAEKDWEAPGAPGTTAGLPGMKTEGSEDEEIRLSCQTGIYTMI